MISWHRGTGKERKEAALDFYEEWRADLLYYIRERMVALCRQRGKRGHVTSDDAAVVLDEMIAKRPELAELDKRLLGATFRNKDWECIGLTKSKRPVNHARDLRMWRIANVD